MKKIFTSVALASTLFISNALAADETELTKAVVKLIKQYNDLELKINGKSGNGLSSDERYFKKIQFELDQLKEDVAALKAGQNSIKRNQNDLNSIYSETTSNNVNKRNLEKKLGAMDKEETHTVAPLNIQTTEVSRNGKGPVAKTEAEIKAMGSYKAAGTGSSSASKKNIAKTAPAPKPKTNISNKNSSSDTAATVYVIQNKESGCGGDQCLGDKNADKIIGDFLKGE